MTLRVLLRRIPALCAVIVLPLLLSGQFAATPSATTSVSRMSGMTARGAASCVGTRWRDAESGVGIGAIRWDAWFDGNAYERFLDPQEWHSRVPFYGMILSPSLVQVRSDSGVVMDEEIGFAAAAGLTYWAFDYYHPGAFAHADSFNYGLRQYLSSPCKDQINFSLVLQGRWLGPADEWPATVSSIVSLAADPGYQTVSAGRPLLYVFDIEPMEAQFGSWSRARAALDDFRAAARTSGLDPYIVGLATPARRAAELADILGFDAVGAYAAIGAGGNGEHPFAELRRANEAFWAEAAETGKSVVPPVSVGWDPRPRLAGHGNLHGHQSASIWYQTPQPNEIREHVKRAMTFADAQSAGRGTVLVYAWNEHDEGGWLTPTLSEGTSRLDAVQQALREWSPGLR